MFGLFSYARTVSVELWLSLWTGHHELLGGCRLWMFPVLVIPQQLFWEVGHHSVPSFSGAGAPASGCSVSGMPGHHVSCAAAAALCTARQLLLFYHCLASSPLCCWSNRH